jgi:death-on-curing protein
VTAREDGHDTAVEFLDLEDLVALVRRLGAGPVRDVGLLEAACARPRASVFGADAYPTLAGKAGALLHSIVANHALVDGNKRLGWLATVVFLDINGWSVAIDDEAAFRLVMDVAEGRLDAERIAGVLAAALTPIIGT